MYNLDKGLKDKIEKINLDLKSMYRPSMDISREDLRDFISNHIGRIESLDKMTMAELEKIKEIGGIVGVDGSVNRLGGAEPHYIELFQGLALSSRKEVEPIYTSNIYSPLCQLPVQSQLEDDEGNNLQDKRNLLLSEIELMAAIEYAENHRPYVIIMDGSLIRFSIDSEEMWLRLRNICEAKKIILVGVIEDIKTSIISKEYNKEGEIYGYDRELLFNLLDIGEIINIDNKVNEKYKKAELSSVFMRSSKSPNVIGMDILDVQKKHLLEISRLIYSLTPENSRGVPMFLDIVDREVKISDLEMESLIKSYLDRDIYEKLFHAQRTKR